MAAAPKCAMRRINYRKKECPGRKTIFIAPLCLGEAIRWETLTDPEPLSFFQEHS